MFTDAQVSDTLYLFQPFVDNVLINPRYIQVIVVKNNQHIFSLKWHDLSTIDPRVIPEEFKSYKLIYSLECASVKEKRRYYADFSFAVFRLASLLYTKMRIDCVTDSGQSVWRNPPENFVLPKAYEEDEDFVKRPEDVLRVREQKQKVMAEQVQSIRKRKQAEREEKFKQFLAEREAYLKAISKVNALANDTPIKP